MRKKANKEDVFNSLSRLSYRTVPQIRKELESRGLRTTGLYLRGGVYVTLAGWCEEEIVESRERSVEDHISIDGYVWIMTGEGPYKATSLPIPEGELNRLREYRRIGSLKNGTKNEVEEKGGLESGLVSA